MDDVQFNGKKLDAEKYFQLRYFLTDEQKRMHVVMKADGLGLNKKKIPEKE